MVRTRRCLALALIASSTAFALPAAARADGAEPGPVAVFDFVAEPGAFPVDGRSGRWTAPGHEVSVWEFDDAVKVDAATLDGRDWIRIELHSPTGRPLTAGVQHDVRHVGERPDEVGILVISNGLGCGDDRAEVTVEDIQRGPDGTLRALDATVVHRCGGDAALRAVVHFER